jgi:hypothetical protein
VYDAALLVEDLEQLPPGPELAALLSTVDRSALDAGQRVDVACARARLVAHMQAELLADMCAVAQDAPDPDFAADELSFALHWTRFGAQSQLAFAQELTGRLPAVHAALLAGVIDLPRARVIAELAGPLEDAATRLVVDTVLPAAPGLTSGQLRAKLRRLVISVDPQAAKKRQEQAVRDRRVECYPDPDGTATLLGTGLPAERAKAAANRIDQLARAAKQSGDDRSMDHLRADLFLDVLDGTFSGQSVDARIEVTVPLQTLLRLKDAPGELAGYGPMLGDIARQLAENSRQRFWTYTVIDWQGRPVQHGTTRRPTAEVAREVRLRDRTCRAPGCRMPAIRCDLDHRRDWQHGGESTVDNLCCLCRHHHRLKHELGWRYRQIAPGVWAWTNPITGRTYIVPPDDIPSG